MVKRPGLTEDSFLKHLFSPKSNPLPTGLRKRPIAFTAGRTKARVSSYNRMSAANQELLKRSGLRDAYLQGNATLKDAKSTLRQTAVTKGIAKPLRAKRIPESRMTNLDVNVAAHIVTQLRNSGYTNVNPVTVHHRVPYMPEDDKRSAVRWQTAQIRAYAGDSTKAVLIDGEMINPLWYH